MCGVSRKCVRLAVAKCCGKPATSPRQRMGRKAAVSQKAAEAALKMLANGKNGTATDVAKALHTQGLVSHTLHKSTVIRHARRVANAQGKKLLVRRGPPPKGMTQSTKLKRLQFAKANLSTPWKQVMFTDRKRFALKYPGSRVHMCRWELHGQNSQQVAAVYQPNKPQFVSIYAGITPCGMTKKHVVAGTSCSKTVFANKKGQLAKNITQAEYKHVLSKTLLPEGRKLFSHVGVSSFIFQQDNDPAHKVASSVIKDWNQKNASSIQLLKNWPPNSPDLNIIENVWAWIQGQSK